MRTTARPLIDLFSAMLIWFAVAAVILVAEIFRSPMVDYRLVAVGAVLPVVEAIAGRVVVLHTLVAPVIVLTVVMVTTQRRRLGRRRLLGIPIGMFLHLVLDATWANSALFWWPAFGLDLGAEAVPERAYGLWVALALEVVGIGLAVWAIRRYELDQPANRSRFLTTGQLDRSVLR